jgi:insulysin
MGIDIRDSLRSYYKKYYSANLMTLAVLGGESLDELQGLVEELFGQVVNTDEPLPTWPQNPYTEKELQLWISIVPLMDLKDMEINFPFLDYSSMWDSGVRDKRLNNVMSCVV